MNTITANAPAKINLFLSVTGKREDGYHNLDSIMQSVSLCDRITAEKSDGADIQFTCSDPSLPSDRSNLAYRAAELFFETFGMSFGVRIRLDKQIPSQAGLGGGSADAAAVLHCLNALCDYPFSRKKLAKMGAKLGADVPFCVLGGTYRAQGIGEILDPLPPLPPCYFAIGMGPIGMSTKDAYSQLDATPIPQEPTADDLCDALSEKDYSQICKLVYNSFERISPMVEPLKALIARTGADAVMMSGSGTAVFGIFTDRDRAGYCVDQLHKNGYRGYLCSPLREENVFEGIVKK